MSRKIAPFMDIVRLEDKEAKLKAFIGTVIELNIASGGASADETVLLIARSMDSPVAKAVAALVREGTIAGPVKTILAIVPAPATDEAGEDRLTVLVREHGGRMVRDVRLFDAHEQLVLGPAASWVGDCMRRDPMKRDAYECYAADCSKTAGWARLSFERLWESCEQITDEKIADAAAAVVASRAIAASNVDEAGEGTGGSSAG